MQYILALEFFKWEIGSWDSRRQEYTFQNTSLPSQRFVVPPQAITPLSADAAQPSCTGFFPSQSIAIRSSITLRRPSTMNLPLAQIFCGMPSPFVPPPTLHIRQPINDGTDLPFTLQKNPSIEDPESVQPFPGPSTLFPSSLHPQAQCVHAIQKRIKQLHHQLNPAHLDRKTLQIIALQFQNDFAVLRYLLLFSVGNICPDDNSVSHSIFNRQINLTLTLNQKYSM